ncbi:MAG: NF038122 family metalloprotease [Hyphomonadaceae bacterium]
MSTVQRLTPSHAAITTPPTDVTRLSTMQIAALNTTQVHGLSNDNVRALTAAQVAAIKTTAITGLSTTQINVLAATQLAAFTTSQVAAFTSTMTRALGADDISAMSRTQIGSFSAAGMKGLEAASISAFSTTQVAALASAALGALSTTQVAALGTTQIAAFGATQLRGISAASVNAMTESQVHALNVSALTALQVSGFTSTTATHLATTQLRALASTQIGALNFSASSALNSTQVAALSSSQLAAMKSTTVGEAGGLQINLVWASSTTKAPAEFRRAVVQAAKSFTDSFSNTAVINIQVGFGETNGTKVSASAVAQTMARGVQTNYATVRNALLQDSDNSEFDIAADATLTATDPTRGGRFLVNTAQEKALGLMNPTASGIDGYVGLSSALPMDYTQSGAAGKYDAVAAMKHEISEVLGRTGSVGRAFGPNVYTSLDLFRYKPASGSSPVARAVTPGGANDFFSIDGGATNLGNFNSTNGGDDYADWNSRELGDAYGFGQAGVTAATPARDFIVMAAIGYNLTARGLAAARGTTINTTA